MTERTWMKDLPAYTPKRVPHSVGGKLLQFQPLSADVLFMLRGVSGPLLKGLTHLFSGATEGAKKDQAFRQKTLNNPTTGESMGFVETDAMPVDILQERFRQRGEVLDEVIRALTSDEARGLVGCLIIDSLRPPDDTAPPELLEGVGFLKNMPLNILFEYLGGVKEANAETFSPFAGMFEGMGELMTLAKGRMKTVLTPEESPGGPESQSDSSADEEQGPGQEPPTAPAPTMVTEASA